MLGTKKAKGVAFTISLMLVVIVYSNLIMENEYIVESNNPVLTSQLDNTPELHAVSDWGGLGSTSACQVHDSDQSVDNNIGSSATFQMSEPSSSTCYLGINLQYNYTVVNGSMIKPSYFDIEIEYSRSVPFEENCAWFSILAVNGHSNPAQGTVIENYDEDQNGNRYWIGSSSCSGGPGDQRAPLPSSPITTDMRDDSSHLQGYSNSQYSGFTVEITVNPWYEPQFNMYIKEVRIIPSNTCLNDSDCDGISDSEEDDDGDGVPNVEDDCANTQNEQGVDEFGCSDYQRDSDNDGVTDAIDQCENTTVTEITNVNAFGCSPSEWDSDLDGYFDDEDMFPLDVSEWEDTDNDNIGNNADLDDDGDGWLDEIEIQCQTNQLSEMSIPKDTDSDGQCDYIDDDDDGDDVLDTLESNCGSNPLDNLSQPSDIDFDGVCDFQDNDNDNDGFDDLNDSFPLDSFEWADNDNDGVGDNTDDDDDNDGWLDEVEIACKNAGGFGDPKNMLVMPIDNETETGPDGLFGTNDDIILGDGLCNAIDQDDDNDGYNDEEDRFDWNPAEWFDYDEDGIGNNFDDDDDGDNWSDNMENQCQTNPLSEMSIPRDTDDDGQCDYIDNDDDGDGVSDSDDQCPESINIDDINSVGCEKNLAFGLQTLSDTLIGRLGTTSQIFALSIMILCIAYAFRVRPRNNYLNKNSKISMNKNIGNQNEQKAISEDDSPWNRLRFAGELKHATGFSEKYNTLIRRYHQQHIKNGSFSIYEERAILTCLLRHAVTVEEEIRQKEKINWGRDSLDDASALVIVQRIMQEKKKEKRIYSQWGWDKSEIILQAGLIKILNNSSHPESSSHKWEKDQSRVLARLCCNIIDGADL